MKEEWLEKLQTRVRSEHDVKAPEGLLDDIKKEMARRGVAPISSARKKAGRLSLWLYRSVSVAAVVAVFLYLAHIIMVPSTPSGQMASVATHKMGTAPKTLQNQHVASSVASDSGKPSAPLSEREPYVKGKSMLAYNSDENTTAVRTVPQTDGDTESPSTAGTVNPGTKKGIDSSPNKPRQPKRYVGTENIMQTERGSEASRFSIATSYSGAAGKANNRERLLLSSADPYGNYDPEFSGANVKSDEIITQVKHRQPVKFGISMRYNINRRWSVQAGLTYSTLISDFSFGKGAGRQSEKQTLHYVGLPVNLSYNFVKTKRFTAYAAAGGEIEKLVKGESRQTEGNNSQENRRNISIRESRPVFSLNAAVGGEYRFSKDISAYAEPGVSYHFNNGSSVKNIYKDKPTNFNLNIGIRINLNK